MTPPTRLVPRYLGQRLDATVEELYRALAYLRADTCERGRCDPGGQCSKHQQRDRRRNREAQA